MNGCYYGIPLLPGERIETEACLSFAALLLLWLSIPAALLSLSPLLLLQLLLAGLFNTFWFLRVFVQLLLLLLLLSWLGVCLFLTHRHFGTHLAFSDRRVLGVANGKQLEAPFVEIVNVFMERSVGGRLFDYGNLTVRTKRGALTLRHLRAPAPLYHRLLVYAENNTAH